MFDKFRKNLRRKTRNELAGLEGFLQNVYWGNHLTKDEAKRNIEDGLVEIHRYKMISIQSDRTGSSKGFQITNDGYILTAAHCVDGDGWKTKIKTISGSEYSLEKICIEDKKHDVALIKAKIDGENTPRIYSVYNVLKIKSPIPCVHIRLENGAIKINGCMSTAIVEKSFSQDDAGNVYLNENHLGFKGQSQKGYSGSPILTSDAQLIAILGASKDDYIRGPHIHHALDLITKYITEEKSKKPKYFFFK